MSTDTAGSPGSGAGAAAVARHRRKSRRVLVFIDDGSYTFDNRVRREAGTLRRAGHDVTVVCPRYPGDARTETTPDGVRVLRFRKLRAGSGFLGHVSEYASSLVFGGLRTLEAALFRGGFDAFQACNPPDHLFLIALPFKLLGKRFVFDHHDVTPELFVSRFGGSERSLVGRALLLAERLSIRLADGVIATNESYRRIEIERGGARPERVAVVRNGPDLGKFVPSDEDDGSGPGVPPYRVGYLGNMNPQDGVDLFVRAAARIAARRGDVEFVLVGGGDSQGALRKLAADLGLGARARFTGRVPDGEMLDALRSCHVCVQPDPWSPLNAVSTMNKPMEYMALRRAVVAFDLPETRVSCGDAALLVPHRSGFEGLADGIERLLDDPVLRTRLARRGRRRVEETLRWERSEPALLDLYERVLAPREKRALFAPGLPIVRDAAARVFLPLADRAIAHNRRRVAAGRAAAAIRRRPAADADRERVAALRELLVFCRDRVPYYRRIFREAGFRPESLTRLEDLREIPPLEKSALRERFDELAPEGVAREKESLRETWSGGSTGEPVAVLHDAGAIARGEAALLWSDGLAGFTPGRRVAQLWGAPSDVREYRSARARLRAFLSNRELFDAFDVGPGRLARWHEALERFRPDVLVAYAGTAFLLARFLLDAGARATYPRRAIVTSAETLTPAMRETIERAFAARVFDRYGSREAGVMAAECRAHAGLHENAADVVLEGIDPRTGDPVEEGEAELLVTTLASRGTPLVRYRIGDLAELLPPDVRARACACGETTGPRLAKVLGRVSDTITAPDGTLVHGEWFTHLLYGTRGVRQFRFAQSAPREFRLEIAAEAGVEPAIASIAAAIRERLGPDARLEVSRVAEIPPAPSGKRRFTVSNVPPGTGTPAAEVLS